MMYGGSMAVAILGLVTYQIAMRSAPRAANPFALLAVAYAMAALACLAGAAVWRWWGGSADAGPPWSHAAAAGRIAAAVVLIEIGYLFVYRSGWSLSVAPGVGQAVTLAVLFVIGLTCFAERATLTKVVGLAMAVAGVYLLSRKG